MVDVYLVSAVHTAIGSYGGSLKDQSPGELAAVPARAAIERAGIDPSQIGRVTLGSVL
ncbi:acetyl-CoA acetyltransferase [Sphingobium sp. TKS]|nr:acetyl-CoA acetyltransferase [Sphingobium sp. TKS]